MLIELKEKAAKQKQKKNHAGTKWQYQQTEDIKKQIVILKLKNTINGEIHYMG